MTITSQDILSDPYIDPSLSLCPPGNRGNILLLLTLLYELVLPGEAFPFGTTRTVNYSRCLPPNMVVSSSTRHFRGHLEAEQKGSLIITLMGDCLNNPLSSNVTVLEDQNISKCALIWLLTQEQDLCKAMLNECALYVCIKIESMTLQENIS